MDRIAPDGRLRAMHREILCIRCCTETGFANQPTATNRNDWSSSRICTSLLPCDVTAPPDNKPLPTELVACSAFLDRELAGLDKVKVVVALGKIGFDAYLNYMKRRGLLSGKKEYVFKHGASYDMPDGKVLLASYHPSKCRTPDEGS